MPDEHLEWRKMAHVNEISMSSQSDELAKYLEYYSSWYSIQKGVAWLRRFLLFLHSTKSKSANKESEDSLKGHLTVKELRSTTESIVKYVQHQCFPDEIERLETIPIRIARRGMVKSIKGLKETTHGYKKNETKRMVSRSNCNTMFLFFLTADSQILRNVHS